MYVVIVIEWIDITMINYLECKNDKLNLFLLSKRLSEDVDLNSELMRTVESVHLLDTEAEP